MKTANDIPATVMMLDTDHFATECSSVPQPWDSPVSSVLNTEDHSMHHCSDRQVFITCE